MVLAWWGLPEPHKMLVLVKHSYGLQIFTVSRASAEKLAHSGRGGNPMR